MEKYTMLIGGRISVVKKAILPKGIYRFNTTQIKLPMAFFTELAPPQNCKIYIDHTILRKKSKTRGIMLSDFNLYYRKLHKYTYADQWTRIECLEIKPHIYDQLIYDKEGNNIQ